MIARQAKLILHTLILMMLLASFSQLAVAVSFDLTNQNDLIETSVFNQLEYDKHSQEQHVNKNSNITSESKNHCPDNQSLLNCGSCMLCAAIFTLTPEKIEVGSIYQSFYVDRLFFAYLDKEIRPPRV